MVSLGVVYLLAVLLVATVWGLWLGIATAVASALAFNYFHIPPTGGLTIADGEHWVALAVFFVTAIVASELAERARHQAREADERRREADLSAEMARLLLRADDLHEALAAGAHRIASALGLPSASIELGAVEAGERRVAFPLREGARQIGTLLVPGGPAGGAVAAAAGACRAAAGSAARGGARARRAAVRIVSRPPRCAAPTS